MANNNLEILNQLYEVLLYKKKDIIAIQKKLSISDNTNRMIVHQSKKAKTLADSYELLLKLIGDLIPIQENLNINGNPILREAFGSNKASIDISFEEIFNLLIYLEENIITIQEELNIIDYTNQKIAEETNKIAKASFGKFEEFYDPLEDISSVLI